MAKSDIIVTPRSKGEVISIQYLRGFAALLVVFYHLHPHLERMGYNGYWPPGLGTGVDIFFVISGYIMWVTTADRNISPSTFIWRRLVRIVPLYWIVTTLVIAVLLVAPGAAQTSRFDFYHAIASYLFIPYPHPILKYVSPVVMTGWTLNYEMFFYLIFSAGLLANGTLRFAFVSSVLFFLVAVGYALGTTTFSMKGFYLSNILLEFVFGMGLGLLSSNTTFLEKIPSSVALAFLLAFLIFMLFAETTDSLRIVTWGIPAAGVVGGGLILELNGKLHGNQAIKTLGDASYSIYLIHFALLSAIAQIWRKTVYIPTLISMASFSAVGIIASVFVGLLFYRFVEMPALRYMRHTPSGAKLNGAIGERRIGTG